MEETGLVPGLVLQLQRVLVLPGDAQAAGQAGNGGRALLLALFARCFVFAGSHASATLRAAGVSNRCV